MFAFQLFVCLLLIGGGVMLLMHGRTVPTWQEEEKEGRDNSFLHEFLYGPPGYGRVRAIGGGIVLTAGGVVGLIVSIIAS